MMIQKKDRFKATYNGKVYEIAGKWDRDYILSPVAQSDDECLIYTPDEMKELVETGRFERLGESK